MELSDNLIRNEPIQLNWLWLEEFNISNPRLKQTCYDFYSLT